MKRWFTVEGSETRKVRVLDNQDRRIKVTNIFPDGCIPSFVRVKKLENVSLMRVGIGAQPIARGVVMDMSAVEPSMFIGKPVKNSKDQIIGKITNAWKDEKRCEILGTVEFYDGVEL